MLKSASARVQPAIKGAPVESAPYTPSAEGSSSQSPSKFSTVSEILKRGPFGAYRQTPVPGKHSPQLNSTPPPNVSPAPIEESGSNSLLKYLFPAASTKIDAPDSTAVLAEPPEGIAEPVANTTDTLVPSGGQAESTLLDNTIDETPLEDVLPLACQICFESYAREPENLVPRRLPACSHIACTGCLRDAWDDGEVTCSECFAASQCGSATDLTALRVEDPKAEVNADDAPVISEALPSELSSCSVCYETYANEPENLVPRRLPACSHVACTGCLRDAWDDGEVTCSECFAASQCGSATDLVSLRVGFCERSGNGSLAEPEDGSCLGETDPQTCPVCYADFADTPRSSAPRRLPACGHLLCTNCLEAELPGDGETCEVTCSECFEPSDFEGPVDNVTPPIQVTKQQLPSVAPKQPQINPSGQLNVAIESKPKKVDLAAFLSSAPPQISPAVPAAASNSSANGSLGSNGEVVEEEEVRRSSSVAVTRRLSVASTSALLHRFQSTSLGSMREWGSEENADDEDKSNESSVQELEANSENSTSVTTAEQHQQSSQGSNREATKAAAIANARNCTIAQSSAPSKALPSPTRVATVRPAAAPTVGTGIVRADEMSPVHPFKIAARFLSQRPIDFGDAWEIVERAKAVLQREPNIVSWNFQNGTCILYSCIQIRLA